MPNILDNQPPTTTDLAERVRFNLIVTWLLSPEIEGGYNNDPDDRGGETNHGISSAANPDLEVASLTDDEIKARLYQNYWRAARCDRLPRPLAWATFDAAVLHGDHKAVVLLQQSLGVTADGINGPQTQAAARRANFNIVLPDLFSRRALFMHDIVTADRSQAKWIRGWFRRLFLLHQFIQRNP